MKQSIFSGGLFIIDILLILGAIYLFYRAYLSSKSGSVTGGSSSNPKLEYSDINVPIYKTWQFKFGCALVVAEIIFIIWRSAEL